MTKRLIDLILGVTLLAILWPIAVAIAILVRLTSPGPAIHWSARVGKDGQRFLMPKFRTMRLNTPQLATHLLQDPQLWFTPVGRWLRKSSLDELPQLLSIVLGHMSFVGPRPALFNQHDLIAMRAQAGVNSIRPGLTGWAQINGRDELSIEEKLALDIEYLRQQSTAFDALVLWRTFGKCISGAGVRERGALQTQRAA